MTTAKRLDHTYPVLRSVKNDIAIAPRKKNPLLVESSEIFELMGWSDLPESIKLTIAIDMIGFRDEICGLFTTSDEKVLTRRKRIHYWVNSFQDGITTEQEVNEALKVSYLE
jgi:hypothetical protein